MLQTKNPAIRETFLWESWVAYFIFTK